MAHFAQLDENDIVTRVLVIEQDVVDTGDYGDPASFVQTSYNTRAGVYYTPNTNDPDPDQSKALRKNFAAAGFKYDRALDAFVPPQPSPSMVLDPDTATWQPPTPRPDDGQNWAWDCESDDWKVFPEGL